MKLPRDLSGADFVRALQSIGYQITRQTGSHMRLTTLERGEHHITVPAHGSLRVGTFCLACASSSTRTCPPRMTPLAPPGYRQSSLIFDPSSAMLP